MSTRASKKKTEKETQPRSIIYNGINHNPQLDTPPMRGHALRKENILTTC